MGLRVLILAAGLAGCGRIGFGSTGSSDGGADTPAIDACPLRAANGNQMLPAVASDGTGFLVVWEDDRAGTADIYGARVTAAGVLDPGGFAIDGGGADARHAVSVASNGQSYYVAWRLDTAGPGPDVYGARVDSTGTVAGPPSNLSAAVESGAFATGTNTATAAVEGAGFLVTWGNHGSGSKLAARPLDASGSPLPGTVLCTTASAGGPAIAFGNSRYLIAFGQGGGLAGGRVTPLGSELGCSTIAPSPMCGAACAAAAFDGTNFVIAWQDGTANAVVAARVDPGGTVVDSPGLPIAQGLQETSPAIAGRPAGGAMVAWTDGTGPTIRARSIAADGTLGAVAPDVTPSGAGPGHPAIAFGSGRYLVVAETTGATTGEDIEGWFVMFDGSVGAPFVISGAGCAP